MAKLRMVLRHALVGAALALAVIVAPEQTIRNDDGGGMTAPSPAIPSQAEPLDCLAPEYGDTCRA